MLCASILMERRRTEVQSRDRYRHVNAVGHAREGVYTLKDAADVSPELLSVFSHTHALTSRAARNPRDVLFTHHNVLKDPAFSHLDLVTCRNC